jgi:hypothetical protein
VAFAGGRERIFGVFTACAFPGVLDNGHRIINAPPFGHLFASRVALGFAATLSPSGTFSNHAWNSNHISEQLARAGGRSDRTTGLSSFPL